MNYHKITVEELKSCKYPNLMVEYQESGFSLNDIAGCIGLPCKRKDTANEVIKRLEGDVLLSYSQAKKLGKLFQCKLEYLFSDTLTIKQSSDIDKDSRDTQVKRIEQELLDNPDLLNFIKIAVALSESERQFLLEVLKNMAT